MNSLSQAQSAASADESQLAASSSAFSSTAYPTSASSPEPVAVAAPDANNPESPASSSSSSTGNNDASSEPALEPYRFPDEKLRRKLKSPEKTPLVLVACGSFSPVTFLHLRMFEMASDYVRHNKPEFEVVAGYLSPVSDAYGKVGLAPAHHRVSMCRAAVQQSPWVMVDPFEAQNSDAEGHPVYVPTAQVLRHFDHEINTVRGGIEGADGQMKKARITLLAGADVALSMGEPGLWSPADLEVILGNYGAFIVERSGTDIHEALATLRQYEDNIWIVRFGNPSDLSSTKVRLFIKKDLSVRYLIPDPVLDYIEQHGLFRDRPVELAKVEKLED